MDLIADRGRRVTVEELNTTQAAGARPQAGAPAQVRRHADRRRRRPSLRERELRRDPAVHGKRRAAPAHHVGRAKRNRARHHADPGRLPGHGRPRDALSDARLGEDRARRRRARHPARPSLDGRHERRLFLPVPDRHAQHRPASAEGDGGRSVLGLQPLAHREGAAGIRRPLLLDAVPAVLRSGRGAAPRRDVRRPQARRRLHGDHGALAHGGLRQRLHEGLPGDGGARPGAVVPLRPELGRADLQELQPLHLGARARLLLVQHAALHQLGGQRHGRALPEAAGDLDRSPASPGCRS